MKYIDSISQLIAAFTKLPGVGKRTAYRYAYHIMNMPREEVNDFANTIKDVRGKVVLCKNCGNYSETDICEICSTRDKSVICVVAEPRDVVAIENSRKFEGVYHILNGTLNPRERIGPNDLRIKELLTRLDGVKEVIIATNPSSEGDVTATYIASLIKPMGIKVTRIASGVPIGSHIEFADEITLSRALLDRKEI